LKEGALFIEGSILDRAKLTETFRGCDCIVHIAAWHGIHEDRGQKNAHDFFDLNVRGAFEVFEAAASLGIARLSSFPRPTFTGRILFTGAAKFSLNSLPRIAGSTGI
jgi:dTDP-D-glucose 4,6-dehydratase